MAQETQEVLSPKGPEISVLHTSLGMSEPSLVQDIFRTLVGPGTKALIVEGWASGTVHKALLPLIKEATERGVSVFVLSDNPKDNSGVRAIKYESHLDVVAAGAILLKDINASPENEDKIFSAIQREINQGRTGAELNEAIIKRFGTPVPYKKH